MACDIYGPIYDAIADRFEAERKLTPQATYGGVLNPDTVISVLRSYDALIFPTFYQGEGHPGVLIEAMLAGLPVITTRFRSIPDLIQAGVNGLLVPPQDAKSLADAIRTLYKDRDRMWEMSNASQKMGQRYDVRRVVPQMLASIGLPTHNITDKAANQTHTATEMFCRKDSPNGAHKQKTTNRSS